MTILGTRPEIIRLSRVMALLEEYVNHILVHTGQNYDYELNEIFFKDLEIRLPDHFLEVDTTSLGTMLGETLSKSEKVLQKEMPDAVLILGDTNSSIAGIIAKRMKIPIFHMEAGNRCFDFNVPEEINRRIIDHIADFNLVYTENARRHLLSEGLPHRRVYLTGSPMKEVLTHYQGKIVGSKALAELELDQGKYMLVSVHREENVDNRDKLKVIMNILNELCQEYNLPLIISTHPRTKDRMSRLENLTLDERCRFMKPFCFSDYVNLQINALCTISDSGTISEESAILSFPAVTLRNSMERPEALDAGTMILTGLDKKNVMECVELAINEKKIQPRTQIPQDYEIENTSWRVLKLIQGTAKLSNLWDGIVTLTE